MGKWLGQNKSNGASEEWIGFLDDGVKLEGTLELAGTFRIDGRIKGTVKANERLHLGENSFVEGEIEGSEISVAGKVKGDIHCTGRVAILASGVVEGDVHTSSLVIEPGGVLDGRCHMRRDSRSSAGVPSEEEPTAGLVAQEIHAAE